MNYIFTLDRRYSVTTSISKDNIRQEYTIGNLYDNEGNFICNTLEDVDRGLDWEMDIKEIRYLKKPHITAIPTGLYEIIYTYSPKFKCQMPLVNNVKGFDGIRIHSGTKPEHTDGCILVGRNTIKGQLTESKATFLKVNDIIKGQIKSGNKVYIRIISTFNNEKG